MKEHSATVIKGGLMRASGRSRQAPWVSSRDTNVLEQCWGGVEEKRGSIFFSKTG